MVGRKGLPVLAGDEDIWVAVVPAYLLAHWLKECGCQGASCTLILFVSSYWFSSPSLSPSLSLCPPLSCSSFFFSFPSSFSFSFSLFFSSSSCSFSFSVPFSISFSPSLSFSFYFSFSFPSGSSSPSSSPSSSLPLCRSSLHQCPCHICESPARRVPCCPC